MKLHAIKNKSEWETTPSKRRNAWQQIAAATSGIVSPGNALTVIGFALSVLGLIAIAHEHYWAGIISLCIERLLDLADGWIANATRTKSPLGELLDTTADKLLTIGALYVLLVTRIIPWWVIIAIAAPHIFIAGVATLAFVKNRRIHPSKLGKLSMAMAWLALVSFLVAHTATGPVSSVILVAGYVVTVVSVALGIKTAHGYITAYSKS